MGNALRNRMWCGIFFDDPRAAIRLPIRDPTTAIFALRCSSGADRQITDFCFPCEWAAVACRARELRPRCATIAFVFPALRSS